MATTVGNEVTLSKLLSNLIVLDYDAIAAYQSAIDRLNDPVSREKLAEFMADHRRHTENLSVQLRQMAEVPPHKKDAKGLLTEGKVLVSGLMGDSAILKAMKSNEDDTNVAYERAVTRHDAPAAVIETLQQNLADERRHRAWIEERITQL